MLRRINIFVLSFIAAVGLFTAGILIWATSEPGARYISERLTREIKDKTGLHVSFRDLDLSLFPPRIAVHEFAAILANPKLECTVEEAEFGLEIIPALRGQFSIEEIYLGAPSCRASLTAQNIEELTAPKTDEPTSFSLDDLPQFQVLAITNGNFEVAAQDNDITGAFALHLKGLGLDITGSEGERPIEIRGLIGELAGSWSKEDKSIDEVISQVNFRVGLSSSEVAVRWFGASLEGANIDVKGASIPLESPLAEEGIQVESLSTDVDLSILGRFPVEMPVMSGTAHYTGSLAIAPAPDEKEPPQISSKGTFRLLAGQVDDFELGDLELSLDLTPKRAKISNAKWDTFDGTLRINATVGLDENLKSKFSVKMERIELARLLEQVTVKGSWVYQKMSGTVKLNGQLNPLRIDGPVKIDVEDHTVYDNSFRAAKKETLLYIPKVFVSGNVLITDKFFAGNGLRTIANNTDVGVEMKINYDGPWFLNAKSSDFHLEDLKHVVGFEVGGHGPLLCKISGMLWDPRIYGTASFQNAVFGGFKLGHAQTEVNFRGSKLSFDNLDVRRGASHYTSKQILLDFDSPAGLGITTTLDADGMTIAHIGHTFDLDLSPFGTPNAALHGPIAIDWEEMPEKFDIRADLKHKRLEAFGEKFGPGSLLFSYNNGNILLDELSAGKGTGSVQFSGSMSANDDLDFTGIVTAVPSSSIDNSVVKDLNIRTTGQAYIFLKGTFGQPSGTAHVRLSDAILSGHQYGPSNVTLKLDYPRLSGSGKIGGDIASISHGEINLENARFKLKSRLNKLGVLRLFDAAPEGHDARLQVTADVDVQGRVHKNPELNGYIKGEKIIAKLDDLVFVNRKPLNVNVKGKKFSIKRTRFWGEDVAVDVKGSIGFDKVHLKARGLASIGSLSSILDPVEKSEGELNFEIGLAGPWSSPGLSGNATLEKGQLRFEDFPHPLTNISGKARITSKKIRIDGVTAKLARGDVGLTGELVLDGLDISDYDFALTLEGLELTPMEDVFVAASTLGKGLELKKPSEGELPTVRGDLLVKKLKYSQDMRTITWSDLQVDRLTPGRQRGSTPRVIDSEQDFFAYDIALHGDRDLVASNNLFDIDLRIDNKQVPLRIIGTNQNIGFLGRIVGKEGFMRFAGKRFEIKYATLSFKDPLRPENPDFLVRAEGQIRDWKIILVAEGNTDDFSINYSSQPFLSKEDIIFVILTGMSRAEHNEFGGSALASLSSPLLADLTGDALPVEFQVYNEYSEAAGAETTRVGLSKAVTEDIYVSVSSSVGATRVVDAQVDYRINDKVSVTMGYEDDNESQSGNMGLDLRFRLEF